MRDPVATLALADYRRRVSESYAAARAGNGESGWLQWRTARDELFSSHPQSALDPSHRDKFEGLRYLPYDEAWRFEAEVAAVEPEAVDVGHSGAGSTSFRAFGRVDLATPAGDVGLTLYWLEAYGGGVFLPFRDTTAGAETYGGGRYLLDTVKGADLGQIEGRLVLDFNYAYHPSCVHSDRWSCPLAPPANHLEVPVEAGERLG